VEENLENEEQGEHSKHGDGKYGPENNNYFTITYICSVATKS